MAYSPNIVFDTSAFLAGLEKYYNKIYTTPQVLVEVKDLESSYILDIAMTAGKIVVKEPSKDSYDTVKNVVKRLSAYGLSETDISVASLAYELKPSLVFTDDLMLQNLLLNLNIQFKSVKLNINVKRKKEYFYVCTGCGRKLDKPYKNCPYCGSRVKVISMNIQ